MYARDLAWACSSVHPEAAELAEGAYGDGALRRAARCPLPGRQPGWADGAVLDDADAGTRCWATLRNFSQVS